MEKALCECAATAHLPGTGTGLGPFSTWVLVITLTDLCYTPVISTTLGGSSRKLTSSHRVENGLGGHPPASSAIRRCSGDHGAVLLLAMEKLLSFPDSGDLDGPQEEWHGGGKAFGTMYLCWTNMTERGRRI